MYCPALRKLALRLGMLLMLLIALTACGGSQSAQEEEGAGRKVPETGDTEGKSLPPGEYATDEFKPAMSFRLREGWRTSTEGAGSKEEPLGDLAEMSDYLFLVYAPDNKLRGTVEFMVDHWVYEVVSPLEDKEIPETPKDMVSWLRNNPELEAEAPEATSVGGEKGESFDVVVSGGLAEDSAQCVTYFEPCVPLFRNAANPGSYYDLAQSEKARFVVLEDVEGEQVTIALTAPTVEFEEFAPQAQKVLDTVKWKGT